MDLNSAMWTTLTVWVSYAGIKLIDRVFARGEKKKSSLWN